MNKVIRTERLIILPFSEKYLTPQYVQWLNDKHLMRYSEQRHKVHTVESCRAYWESFHNSPNRLWAITREKEKTEHIGNINAYIDTNNKIAEIGIIIGNNNSHGYGYEAFKGVCNYLFSQVAIRKITAGTVSENLRMINLMKKMNMRMDGIRKRHYLIEGEEVDIVHMALFHKDISDD